MIIIIYLRYKGLKILNNIDGGVINIEENILDVRNVVPFERHRLIFETFNNLKEGENFILINDHDPKPLYYQFKYELEGQFNGSIYNLVRMFGKLSSEKNNLLH